MKTLLSLEKLKEHYKYSSLNDQTNDLWVGNSLQVSQWEGPIQDNAAQYIAEENPSSIIEIGYGLGMFAISARELMPKSKHLIIEAHALLAEKARTQFLHDRNVEIMNMFWDDFLLRQEVNYLKFDAIYFDAGLPLTGNPGTSVFTSEEIKDNALLGFTGFNKLLCAGGVFVFLDPTAEVTFSESELKKNNIASFSHKEYKLNIPQDCLYAKGNKIHILKLITI